MTLYPPARRARPRRRGSPRTRRPGSPVARWRAARPLPRRARATARPCEWPGRSSPGLAIAPPVAPPPEAELAAAHPHVLVPPVADLQPDPFRSAAARTDLHRRRADLAYGAQPGWQGGRRLVRHSAMTRPLIRRSPWAPRLFFQRSAPAVTCRRPIGLGRENRTRGPRWPRAQPLPSGGRSAPWRAAAGLARRPARAATDRRWEGGSTHSGTCQTSPASAARPRVPRRRYRPGRDR